MTTFRGGPIFDGARLHHGQALTRHAGRVVAFGPEDGVAAVGDVVDLAGDILSPGYVDLQVNGGGGVMFNDAPGVETLWTIASAHARLGTATFLPTLITDTEACTAAAIEAAVAAIADGVPGVGGLHLEGPHLSGARNGAHDAALIRPMTERDLARLCDAASRLPTLVVTLAPESVSLDQVRALVASGVIVALGHTDADYETCLDYQRAGASCVTHLFNAMSPLGSRTPGLVGAALDCGGLSAGLIADGLHVHPASMRAALAAKTGPGGIFLVSDAMAPAGTDLREFPLNGRMVHRADGRLTLADGTLAGADLNLTRAIKVLTDQVGTPLETALAMATSIPARLARQPSGLGEIVPGVHADLIRISLAEGRAARVA